MKLYGLYDTILNGFISKNVVTEENYNKGVIKWANWLNKYFSISQNGVLKVITNIEEAEAFIEKKNFKVTEITKEEAIILGIYKD